MTQAFSPGLKDPGVWAENKEPWDSPVPADPAEQLREGYLQVH